MVEISKMKKSELIKQLYIILILVSNITFHIHLRPWTIH
jgi:hypothetical protein